MSNRPSLSTWTFPHDLVTMDGWTDSRVKSLIIHRPANRPQAFFPDVQNLGNFSKRPFVLKVSWKKRHRFGHSVRMVGQTDSTKSNLVHFLFFLIKLLYNSLRN